MIILVYQKRFVKKKHIELMKKMASNYANEEIRSCLQEKANRRTATKHGEN
jgi:hypothetical protein